MSLLVRIWLHGILLFAGVVATVFIARWAMSDVDEGAILRARPYLVVALAERVLQHQGDDVELARELGRVEGETPLHVAVFGADGSLRASSIDPAPAPPSGAERGQLASPRWSDGRLVVGSPRGLVVVTVSSPPSIPWHVGALLGAALLLAFVFVAAPLTWSIARPLGRLGILARELGGGDLAVRSRSQRRDEIGDLARSFDAMAAQIQRLRAAERELLGDVSHELRTPLARMRVVLDLASDADLERSRRYIGEIATDLAELEQLIDDIITSAQLDPEAARWDEARPPLRRSIVSVGEVVDAALARFRARWPDRALEEHRGTDTHEIDGDPSMLRRVLDNLLDNARKYSADDAPISVTTALVDPARVRVEVVDRGVGIASEDHARVFSPFFRADPSRARSSGGVGLGLVLARRIVEAHGGTIGFHSEAELGSRFWFDLQLATEPHG